MIFTCPHCSGKLNKKGESLVCDKGHSFDLSKEGYCNLLVRGGFHGDNKEMVVARRNFLSRGYYRPMAERLASILLSYAQKGQFILDSGSGEGYYTDLVERAIYERDSESNVYGFDISKDAVKAAAKRNGRLNLAVASAYRQPFADGSVDLAYNVFSPLATEEIGRILKSKGIFIMVIPDVMHLYELKAAVYDDPYKNTVEDTALSGFSLVADEPVHYDMRLDNNEDILSLFKMTPYAYRTKKENAERILSLNTLTVSAHFRILVYRKDF